MRLNNLPATGMPRVIRDHKLRSRRGFLRIVAAAAVVPALAGGVRALAPRGKLYDWQLEVMGALSELALWHEDAGTATGTSRDVDDDKFLALAVTGQADAIISGDGDLLELVVHEGIPILTPAQFLQRLLQSEA